MPTLADYLQTHPFGVVDDDTTNQSLLNEIGGVSFISAPLLGTFFYDNSIYVFTSEDGVNFSSIAGGVYYPPSPRDLRDPSVIQIGNTLWVVHTNGTWLDPDYGNVDYFTLVKSTDGGRTWTFVQNISCAAAGDVTNTWAPEWFRDNDGSVHVIVSLRLDGVQIQYETHPLVDDLDGPWSDPVLIDGIATASFDLFVIRQNDNYIGIASNGSTMVYYTATDLLGPWTGHGPISINGSNGSGEGQSIIRLPGGRYQLIYLDYGLGNMQVAFSNGDLSVWTGRRQFKCSIAGINHGTVINARADFNAIAPVEMTTRVTTQFDKVNTTLANVTGLSVPVLAGRTYSFHAQLFVNPDVAGGLKLAIGGTATATTFIASATSLNGDITASLYSRETTIGSALISGGDDTHKLATIDGMITVNAAGTLTVQFAQASANGTSSVLVGSTFTVQEIP